MEPQKPISRKELVSMRREDAQRAAEISRMGQLHEQHVTFTSKGSRS